VTEALARFGVGLTFSVLAGLAVFRGHLFRPYHPAFACLTVGAVTAGILTLVRQSRPGQALTVVLAFTALRFAIEPVVPLGAAVSALLLGLGLFVVALIFDLLAGSTTGITGQLFNMLSMRVHFESISRGVVDSSDLIYYFSLIFLGLFFSEVTLAKRNKAN